MLQQKKEISFEVSFFYEEKGSCTFATPFQVPSALLVVNRLGFKQGNSYSAYIFFHVFGLNKIRTGKISNRPINIVNVKRMVEKGLNAEKEEYAPTVSKAGPIFEIQDNAAEKLLKKPCVCSYVPVSEVMVTIVPLAASNESRKVTIIKINKYKVINENTSLIVFSSKVLPSNLTLGT